MPSFNVALQDVALLPLQDLCPVFVGLKADVITRKEKQRKESSRNLVVYPRLEHIIGVFPKIMVPPNHQC